VEDREQPRPQIRSLLPQVELSERAGEAILYEVIRRGDVARQGAGIASQARDFGFDSAMDFGHENSSALTPAGAAADPTRASLSARCNRLMSAPSVLCKEL
jgi:hypothetical protein